MTQKGFEKEIRYQAMLSICRAMLESGVISMDEFRSAERLLREKYQPIFLLVVDTIYSKPVWICATYNMKGRKYCASKQIPENILQQTTANVLELEEFDEEAFAAAVERIHVTGPNSLRYIFRDGIEITV